MSVSSRKHRIDLVLLLLLLLLLLKFLLTFLLPLKLALSDGATTLLPLPASLVVDFALSVDAGHREHAELAVVEQLNTVTGCREVTGNPEWTQNDVAILSGYLRRDFDRSQFGMVRKRSDFDSSGSVKRKRVSVWDQSEPSS